MASFAVWKDLMVASWTAAWKALSWAWDHAVLLMELSVIAFPAYSSFHHIG
jgi:hypothetical protein